MTASMTTLWTWAIWTLTPNEPAEISLTPWAFQGVVFLHGKEYSP
jgi:hypothetical protein